MDFLGSTRAISDDSGELVRRLDYKPFGGVLPQFGEADTQWQFTGGRYDDAAQSTHLGARHLYHATGRFGQVDPLATEFPAWSPYVYANNNPFRFIDKTGHQAKDLFYYLEHPDEGEKVLGNYTSSAEMFEMEMGYSLDSAIGFAFSSSKTMINTVASTVPGGQLKTLFLLVFNDVTPGEYTQKQIENMMIDSVDPTKGMAKKVRSKASLVNEWVELYEEWGEFMSCNSTAQPIMPQQRIHRRCTPSKSSKHFVGILTATQTQHGVAKTQTGFFYRIVVV